MVTEEQGNTWKWQGDRNARLVTGFAARLITVFRFARVVGHPLEDGLAAAAAAHVFIGGDNGVAAAGVTDDSARGVAVIVSSGYGGDQGKRSKDGEQCFHLA